MQPVEPQYRAAATLGASCRRPAGLEPPSYGPSSPRPTCLAPSLVVSRAAWRASCCRPSIPLAGARRAQPQHAPSRCPASPIPLPGEPQAPGSGLWSPGSGLWAPRSRQTCVAERTLARNLCCRTDAKPLLQAPCRPFCKTSDHKAAKMQQKFSPERAEHAWQGPAGRDVLCYRRRHSASERRPATAGSPTRPSRHLRRGSPQRQPAERGRRQA